MVGCSRAWAEGMGGRRPGGTTITGGGWTGRGCGAVFFSVKNVLCFEPSVSSDINQSRIFWVSLGLGIDWVKSCDRPPLHWTQ